MEGFYLEYHAPIASFRDPGSQLYHSCLPLPPFSTLVGIAGAALGMSFESIIEYFRKRHIFAGVSGISRGYGIDLWNYAKITSSRVVGKDILNREFLAFLEGKLFYASSKSDAIKELYQGFQSPVFCLSLGGSDDLFINHYLSPVLNVDSIKTVELKNCVIPLDISGQYEFDWARIKQSPLAVRLQAPKVFKVPVDYEFKGSVRKGIRYQTFSYIAENIKLKEPVTVFRFAEEKVPMYALD